MRASRAVTAKAKGSNWLELGSSAVDAGDLATAEQCFREAVKADKRNSRCHFYLAIVLEAVEKFGHRIAGERDKAPKDQRVRDPRDRPFANRPPLKENIGHPPHEASAGLVEPEGVRR